MGEEYSFDQGTFTIPLEGTVLVTDGTSVWQEEESVEHYTNSTDTTLSENINDSYMTADDAGNNSTQYFSVLESTSETILNDMSHISLDVTRVGNDFTITTEENNIEPQQEANNQDVVLFRVDGSDALYGVQIAQDEEGNFQKYQFQVRQNTNGEFETIPETIQIVPFSSDDQLPVKYSVETDLEPVPDEQPIEASNSDSVFVKQEHLNDETMHSIHVEEQQPMFDNDEAVEDEEHLIEIRPHEEKEEMASSSQVYHHIKGEIDEDDVYVDNQELLKKESEDLAAYQQMYFQDDSNLIEDNQENSEETTTTITEEATEEEDSQEMLASTNLEMYFSEAPDDDDSLGSQNTDYLNEDSVDQGSEQGIDEIHITTDDSVQYEHIILDSRSLYKSKILEVDTHLEPVKDTALKNINRIVKNNNKAATTILIKNIEKENLITKSFIDIKKPNPRSLLKTSVIEQDVKPEFEKRFAKGKIAVQARQFQNYISQTKILEVPVRTERLPRKQKIKPLVRSGEEIVVQEVVVSSNGFIETREDGVLRERKPLVPTECIQITDSDDDTGRKKRKKVKRTVQVEIIISDSEDDPDPVEIQTEEVRKLQHQCEKCPKSFPSEGSLRSHMQYHNYSESGDKTAEPSENIASTENISKYVCSICKETFKNNILLNRHLVTHVDTNLKLECKLCNKKFSNQLQFITHKRSHVKDQMFKKTTLSQVSPKKPKPVSFKSKSRTSINISNVGSTESQKHICGECKESFKNNILLNRHILTHKNKSGKYDCSICRKVFDDQLQWISHKNGHKADLNEQLKCKECGKLFTTPLLLSSHVKSHKQYACKNCSSTFLSKFVLERHVLKNCVKSPVRKKASPRKSVLCSPRGVRRMSTLRSTYDKTATKQPNTLIKVKCDFCESTFKSHKNLLEHKVHSHQLNTPDKTIGKETRKKMLYKQRPEHSGIPLAKKMKNAFAGLKSKLNE